MARASESPMGRSDHSLKNKLAKLKSEGKMLCDDDRRAWVTLARSLRVSECQMEVTQRKSERGERVSKKHCENSAMQASVSKRRHGDSDRNEIHVISSLSV